MDKVVIFASVFVILIVVEVSDASLLSNFRYLAAAVEGKEKHNEVSPSPSPVASVKGDNHGHNLSTQTVGSNAKPNSSSDNKTPPGSHKENHAEKDNSSDNKTPSGSHKENHAEKDNSSDNKTPPGSHKDNPAEKDSSGETPENSPDYGNCATSKSFWCTDGNRLTACLRDHENGLKEFFLLVQNNGENTLTVNITALGTAKINTRELQVAQHHTEKINISVDAQKRPKIVLNAGNGDCVLQGSSNISAVDFFWQIRSYATSMTPMYGAYALFLTVLMAGMMWVCCKFRKRQRRGDGGVPYQELEMGIPQSVSAIDADTTESWDGVWDDDWEQEKAVRPADKQRAGNLSANGLTSRSSNRDGWDDDWDE